MSKRTTPVLSKSRYQDVFSEKFTDLVSMFQRFKTLVAETLHRLQSQQYVDVILDEESNIMLRYQEIQMTVQSLRTLNAFMPVPRAEPRLATVNEIARSTQMTHTFIMNAFVGRINQLKAQQDDMVKRQQTANMLKLAASKKGGRRGRFRAARQ